MTSAENAGQRFREPVAAQEGLVRFRIAHLSDLHFAKRANHKGYHDLAGVRARFGLLVHALWAWNSRPMMTSHQRNYLRALISALSGRTEHTRGGYDGYIITGDLATTGELEDLSVAVSVLRGEPSTANPGLAAPPLGEDWFAFPPGLVALLPGNHDRYLGKCLLPKSAFFEAVNHFGSDWRLESSSPPDGRKAVNHFRFPPKGDVEIAVVSADFSFARTPLRPWKWWGCGEAPEHVLDQMVERTKRLEEVHRGIVVIWAMHFPPVADNVERLLRLNRYEHVARRASDASVDLILCGHTHKPKANLRALFGDKVSGARVVCAGTPCSAGVGRRSYWELDIDVIPSTSKTRARISRIVPTEMKFTPDLDGMHLRLAPGKFLPVP